MRSKVRGASRHGPHDREFDVVFHDLTAQQSHKIDFTTLKQTKVGKSACKQNIQVNKGQKRFEFLTPLYPIADCGKVALISQMQSPDSAELNQEQKRRLDQTFLALVEYMSTPEGEELVERLSSLSS